MQRLYNKTEGEEMKIRNILLLSSLFLVCVFEAGGMDKFKEIEHKKPKYIKRKSSAWKDGGRVIGEIKNTPDKFTIKFSNAGIGKVMYTYTSPATISIYQTKRLPPGTYDMKVEAEGFLPYTIRKVKLFARKDCVINLIFGRRVYDNTL